MLPLLPLVHLRLTYYLMDPLPHAAVQGSLWRGALGYALKQSTCVYPDPFDRPCPDCPLYQHCVYPPLFEPIILASRSATSSDDAARPFVLEPPLHATTALPIGGTLDLGLVLLGPALQNISTFLRAAALLGERGIGQSAARATLIQVEASSAAGTVAIWPQSDPPPLPLLQTEHLLQYAAILPENLTLRFVTPTYLKRNRVPVRQPDADVLLRALLRRLISLAALYGTAWYPETHRLIALAASLSTEGKMEWRSASHLSTRQQQRVPLDGFEGILKLQEVPV